MSELRRKVDNMIMGFSRRELFKLVVTYHWGEAKRTAGLVRAIAGMHWHGWRR